MYLEADTLLAPHQIFELAPQTEIEWKRCDLNCFSFHFVQVSRQAYCGTLQML